MFAAVDENAVLPYFRGVGVGEELLVRVRKAVLRATETVTAAFGSIIDRSKLIT